MLTFEQGRSTEAGPTELEMDLRSCIIGGGALPANPGSVSPKEEEISVPRRRPWLSIVPHRSAQWLGLDFLLPVFPNVIKT